MNIKYLIFIIVLTLSVLSIVKFTYSLKVPKSPGEPYRRNLVYYIEAQYSLQGIKIGDWKTYAHVKLATYLNKTEEDVILNELLKAPGYDQGEISKKGHYLNIGGSYFSFKGYTNTYSIAKIPHEHVPAFYKRKLIANSTTLCNYNEYVALSVIAYRYVHELKALNLTLAYIYWWGYASSGANSYTIEVTGNDSKEIEIPYHENLFSSVRGFITISPLLTHNSWLFSSDSFEFTLPLFTKARANLTISNFSLVYTQTIRVESVDMNNNPLPITVNIKNVVDSDGDLLPEADAFACNSYVYYVWNISTRIIPGAPSWLGNYSLYAPLNVTINDVQYVFDYWETSDGLYVLNRTNPNTFLVVLKDGVLRAVYRPILKNVGILRIQVVDDITGNLWNATLRIDDEVINIAGTLQLYMTAGEDHYIQFLDAPSRWFLAWSIHGGGILDNPLSEAISLRLLSNTTCELILFLKKREYTLSITSKPIVSARIKIDSRTDYTPISLSFNEPTLVTIKAISNKTWEFKWWEFDNGTRITDRKITVYVNRKINLTAVYYPRKGIFSLEIEKVKLIPVYMNMYGSEILISTYLAPSEYLGFRVYARAKIIRLSGKGKPEFHPINITLTLNTSDIAYFLNDSILINTPITFNLTIDRAGESLIGTIGTWVIKDDIVNLTGNIESYEGIVTFFWNSDSSSGSGLCRVYVSSISQTLLSIPLSHDSLLLLVVYNWSDGSIVKGRTYLSSTLIITNRAFKLTPSLIATCPYTSSLKLNIDPLASISYTLLGSANLYTGKVREISYLNTGLPWVMNKSCEIHLVGIIVNYFDGLIVNASIVDLASSLLIPGNVTLLIEGTNGSYRSYEFEINDKDDFVIINLGEFNVSESDNVWLLGLARRSVNIIYLPSEYSRIPLKLRIE